MPRGLLATSSLIWYLAVAWYVPQVLEPDPAEPEEPLEEVIFLHRELPREPEVSDGLELATLVLERATYFTSADVGPAGITPTEVHAWLLISRAPDAESRFRRLWQSPNPAAVAFGAAGLAYVNPEALAALRPDRESEEETFVATLRGCVQRFRPLAELLDEMGQGNWWPEYLRSELR